MFLYMHAWFTHRLREWACEPVSMCAGVFRCVNSRVILCLHMCCCGSVWACVCVNVYGHLSLCPYVSWSMYVFVCICVHIHT